VRSPTATCEAQGPGALMILRSSQRWRIGARTAEDNSKGVVLPTLCGSERQRGLCDQVHVVFGLSSEQVYVV